MQTKKNFCVIFAALAALAAAITGAVIFLKRRKNRNAALMLIVALVIFAVPITTYAGANYIGANEITEYDAYDYEIISYEMEISEIIYPEIPIPEFSLELFAGLGALFESLSEPQIFTPSGNLTLVDDFWGETERQFITVTTRNGHFFYIIIDRAADRDNVHFLNQVNELDLFMILEEELLPYLSFEGIAPLPEEPAPEEPPAPEVTPDEAPAPERRGNVSGIILTIVIFAAIGGGVFYYFKVRKPKPNTNSAAVANQSEFEIYEDDFEDIISDEENNFNEDEDIPDFAISEELSFEPSEFITETSESDNGNNA